MALSKWNQDINAGENWMADIILSFSTGVARDLTGHTLTSGIKRHYKSVGHKETITVNVLDPAAGSIRLSLSNLQTTNLSHGKYLYDLELTEDATGIKERVIEGVITIRPEVTVT